MDMCLYRSKHLWTLISIREHTYRAANWLKVGETAGRAQVYAIWKVSDGKTEIYVYPLRQGWQSRLCRESNPGKGELPRPDEPQDWAEEDFV